MLTLYPLRVRQSLKSGHPPRRSFNIGALDNKISLNEIYRRREQPSKGEKTHTSPIRTSKIKKYMTIPRFVQWIGLKNTDLELDVY